MVVLAWHSKHSVGSAIGNAEVKVCGNLRTLDLVSALIRGLLPKKDMFGSINLL